VSKRVFVLMPFHDGLKDLWNFGIRQPCEKLGWRCIRADDKYDLGLIVQKIQSEISAADLVIAELTEKNANVFYELGFAHALGKPTILLARSREDLTAFDTMGYQHILHDGSASELSPMLQEVLADAGSTSSSCAVTVHMISLR
jgi:hypothetical protein